jgi:membrane protease YdiL (CAAX protease family)
MNPSPPSDTRPQPGRGRRIFFGPHGLRAGWSLALYYTISLVLYWIGGTIFLKVYPLPPKPAWTAGLMIAFELLKLAIALAAVYVLGKVEGRTFATYGIPRSQAFGRRFWQGALWGALSIVAVIAGLAACGAYRVHGLNVRGLDGLGAVLLWLLAALLVGVYEEIDYRGAPLFTLSRGIGFWPAALLLSLYFGGEHYFQKPMETWIDFLSVGLIGLWFCFAVRRTGDVWLAIGWHFAYNFGSLAIFGGPNTGNQGRPVEGHLLASTFHGPDWLTGGPMGPEASVFIFPVIAAMFLLLHFRYRTARFPVLPPPE